MTKKRNRVPYVSKDTQIQKNVEKLDILAIDSLIKGLSVQRDIAIEKAMNSDDIVDIMKAQQYLEKNKAKSPELKSHVYLPEDFTYNSTGFKQPITGMPFEVLQRMGSIPVVNSIIKTRINQVKLFLTFSSDVNKAGYTIKRKSSIFEDESKKNLSPKDKQTIEYIVNFLENGGKGGKWDDGDDLHDFVSKLLIDSLSMDQCAFEVVRDRKGDLFKHVAVDGSLIRQLDSNDPRYASQFEPLRVNGFLPKYAQVWNNQIVKTPNTNDSVIYYPWELGYGIRNRTSNVRTNGYGISELEVANEIVTYILWGFQYNGNFFKQGSNPKGFINIKNGNMNNSVLNEFRQSWRQMMSGVNNCLVGETFIVTNEGRKELKDFFVDNDMDKRTQIWTGKKFEEALVYKSGKKKLNKITLNNGMSIESSPEHRFKTVNEEGEIVWKKRFELKEGDFLMVNKNSITNSEILYYKGIEVESDLFELIGWMIGDGYIGENLPKKKRGGLVYHQDFERMIQQYHVWILNKYNINNLPSEQFFSEKQNERRKEQGGFKTVGESTIKTDIIDSDFFEFLFNLGFTSSKEGKTIPKFIFSCNPKYRRALLRGFFSADCHVAGGRYIQMSITNDKLRQQTKELLLSEGIRCGNHEGKERLNQKLGQTKAGYLLLIKDNDLFFERVGLLHNYKQLKDKVKVDYYSVKESMPQSLSKKLISEIKEDIRLRYKETKDRLMSQKFTNAVSACLTEKEVFTFNRFKSVYDLAKSKLYKYDVEKEVFDFHFEKIIKLEEFEEEVEMYDVEVYDNENQFIANGILSHNSHKLPIFEGVDLEWTDMQASNKDMEFQQWTEFLIVVFCSVFSIDPSELGFHFKDQADMFGQQGQKERLDHSQKKGLEPLLKFLEKLFNKYIVSEIDPEFEFKFTGISIEDETAKVALDKAKLDAGVISQEDAFQKYSGRKCDPKKDTILNQVYQSAQNAKQMGGDVMNQVADEEEEGGDENNPFSQYEKSIESSPIMQESMKYFDQIFKK